MDWNVYFFSSLSANSGVFIFEVLYFKTKRNLNGFFDVFIQKIYSYTDQV